MVLALMAMPSAAIAAENYMSLLDQIDKALTSRDWALSERLIKTALEMEPANPSNYLLMSNLGTVYRNQGKLMSLWRITIWLCPLRLSQRQYFIIVRLYILRWTVCSRRWPTITSCWI